LGPLHGPFKSASSSGPLRFLLLRPLSLGSSSVIGKHGVGLWRGCALAVAFAASVVASGCDSRDAASGGPAGMMGSRGPVGVYVAQAVAESYTDTITALGSLRANEAVDISSRVSSVIESVYFEAGQFVKEGQVLVELDSREIAADLAVAQAEFEKVRNQYQRSKALGKSQVVSESELDQLAADMRRTEADIRSAQARLDDSTIRAPIAGYVGLRRVSPGGIVGPDTLITTLDDTRVMKLDFAVPESFLAVIREGMQVGAQTAAYPEQAFTGEVISIDSRIDPATRSITVVAAIPNPDNRLKPGMFMTVALQRQRDDVLFVPEEAVAPRSGRQFVYLVTDGRVREQEVSLGVRNPGRVEIVDGLSAGDTVVVEGVQKIRDGAAVEILSAGA
jgi:membrane fusion protein (multidrug efflux system)